MATYEIIIPQMGEGIIEATLTRWLKNIGDTVESDEPVAEIATDKVDSEIPSPASGILVEVLANEGDVVPVGNVIGIISTDGSVPENKQTRKKQAIASLEKDEVALEKNSEPISDSNAQKSTISAYISPLVRSISASENLSTEEILKIQGTGKNGRVTKSDVFAYLHSKKHNVSTEPVSYNGNDEIIEMDRMRRIIADHMVMSVKVSPHVTSFAEADLTNIVNWREKHKNLYEQRESKKLTFTPIFIEILAKALAEFPQLNASIDGYKIILKKNINIGMAVALPSGNLIVPVIRNANTKRLPELVTEVNDISNRAKNNRLNPEEIQNATFTLTNLGSFGSMAGTPIINQPQLGIIAVGAIKKKPVVIETSQGDTIGIRHMMIISLAYDHRAIDGALGGKFLNRFVELLETFDTNRSI